MMMVMKMMMIDHCDDDDNDDDDDDDVDDDDDDDNDLNISVKTGNCLRNTITRNDEISFDEAKSAFFQIRSSFYLAR